MAKKDDLLKQAREDFEIAEDYWRENRKKWLDDTKFCIPGNQWPEKLRKDREAVDKPCLETDKLNQYVRQVVNDSRQNRPGIKVRPVDDGGDKKVAEAYQGIIRDICDKSNADEAFDTAIEHAARGGFGFFRVLSQYVHEKTFEQELIVRRVRNALACLLGPHQLADGSDAEFGFFIDEVPKKSFKRQYPNAKIADWKNEGFSGQWSSDHAVRVCEYYYKVKVPTTLFLLGDGTCVTEDEYANAKENGGAVLNIVEKREIPTEQVKWCRLTGAEVLEENDWLGCYIPIIPVYGNETDLEGEVIVSGLIRGAKDSQRLHNYSRTKFAERVAMTPQAPFMAAREAVEGNNDDWTNANSTSKAVLLFNAYTDDGKPLPTPTRIAPSDIPAGFAQDAQMSEHDIQASMGMYNASLGEKSNEKSGRAIMARQREGDTSTFHYQDNLNRAIRYLGRILVDAIPKYYDSKRVVRILGEDGEATMAQIDPRSPKPSLFTGQMPIYNLNAGRFDVSVSAGPSYTTKRQEQADAMIELTTANPGMWQTHGDLIVEAQDWHGADKFAERTLITMPPPLRQAIEQAKQASAAGKSPEVAAVIQQAQQVIGAANQKAQQLEGVLQQATQHIADLEQQLKSKNAETQVKAASAETDQYEAETQRMQALAPAMTPEMVAEIVAQTVQQIMAQPVPGGPPMKPPDVPIVAAPAAEPQPPPGGFFTP